MNKSRKHIRRTGRKSRTYKKKPLMKALTWKTNK